MKFRTLALLTMLTAALLCSQPLLAQVPATPAATAVSGFTSYQDAFNAGITLFNQGHPADAIAPFQAAVSLAQNDGDKCNALWYLGHANRNSGNWPGAEKPFQNAADLAANTPDKFNYLRYLAETKRYVGDLLSAEAANLTTQKKDQDAEKKLSQAKAKWTEAADVYKSLLALTDVDLGPTWSDLGDTQRRLKDYDAARQSFAKMVEVSLESARFNLASDSALRTAATYFEESKYADARAALEKAMAIDNLSPRFQSQVLDQIRESYRRESTWKGIADTDKRILAIKGISADSETTAWTSLLDAYRQLGNPTDYDTTLQGAVKSQTIRSDQRASFLCILADSLRQNKDYDGARATLTKGLQIPGLPTRTAASLHFQLAAIAIDQKEYPTAHAEYDKIASDSNAFLDNRLAAINADGAAFITEGNWSAARDQYAKLKLAAVDAPNYIWAAQQGVINTYLGEKKYDQAVDLLRAMLKLDQFTSDTKAGETWTVVNSLPADEPNSTTAIALIDETLAIKDVSSTWFGHMLRHKSDRLISHGKYKEAAETLENLVTNAEAANRIDALFRLLNLYQSQKDNAQAILICTRIITSEDASDAQKQQAETTKQQLSAPTPP